MNNEKDILNNLPNMYEGQKAVCVRPYEVFGLHKGREYTITDAARCQCGLTLVSYGEFCPKGEYVGCPKCGHHLKTKDLPQYYCNSDRFRQVKSQSFPLITLSKVIEEQHELVSSN